MNRKNTSGTNNAEKVDRHLCLLYSRHYDACMTWEPGRLIHRWFLQGFYSRVFQLKIKPVVNINYFFWRFVLQHKLHTLTPQIVSLAAY